MATTVTGDDRAELLRRTERWFVHRGVPHFIEDYNASSDVFTRAWAFLALIFVAEMVGAVSSDLPLWVNALAVAGGVGAIVITLAGLNRVRGRPWYRRPDTIGPLELVAFVFVPTVLPLIFGLQEGTALLTVTFNIAVIGVVYVVVSYGLLPMTRWAVGQLLNQLLNVANLMIRSLPLLLIFTMFMFVNAEMWKVATDIPGAFYAASIALLVVTGSLFMVIRMPAEVATASRFESWDEVRSALDGTPLDPDMAEGLDDPPDPSEPTGRARFNVGLVLFTSQSIQIIFVTLAIFAFYVLLGIFLISDSTIALWTGNQSPGVLAEFTLWDNQIVLTGALLRSAAFIAAVAGLQFTVSALTDQSYREEFVEENLESMRQNFAVRALYLARLYR